MKWFLSFVAFTAIQVISVSGFKKTVLVLLLTAINLGCTLSCQESDGQRCCYPWIRYIDSIHFFREVNCRFSDLERRVHSATSFFFAHHFLTFFLKALPAVLVAPQRPSPPWLRVRLAVIFSLFTIDVKQT
jgi:hypothetical protein